MDDEARSALEAVSEAQGAADRMRRRQLVRASAEAACASSAGPQDGIVAVKVNC